MFFVIMLNAMLLCFNVVNYIMVFLWLCMLFYMLDLNVIMCVYHIELRIVSIICRVYYY
jgi:hypothetical protein